MEKYLFCLGFLVIFALLAKNLVRSAIGREWMAIRDMDVAAAVIGIRPMYAKLSAFAVSSFIIGVAGAGQEISTRPFQLVTGRRWMGTAFGGVKGRSELPGMVDDAMAGRIALAPFVTHTMGLSGINHAFDLMHQGESIRSVVHFEGEA